MYVRNSYVMGWWSLTSLILQTQVKQDSVAREDLSKQIEEAVRLEKNAFPDGHSSGHVGYVS